MTQLYIDCETRRTRDQRVIDRIIANVKPPGNYKKAETISQWWASEGNDARNEAINRTALDGTYGSLASFAWAEGDDPLVRCVYGDDEVGMLHAVREVFNTKGFDLTVAFNGEFDFRFLKQRFIIKKVPAPFLPGLSRGDYYFDPMREWAGWKGFISQAELEIVLDIHRDSEDVTGGDIGLSIDAGDWAAVERHNIADVENLREIYKRMTL